MSKASAEHLREVVASTGVLVCGRRQFVLQEMARRTDESY
ncbi:hypothetical protein BH18ACT9_BH18ACT9_08210 [soil metagenome]